MYSFIGDILTCVVQSTEQRETINIVNIRVMRLFVPGFPIVFKMALHR